jgi:hypothetical protein
MVYQLIQNMDVFLPIPVYTHLFGLGGTSGGHIFFNFRCSHSLMSLELEEIIDELSNLFISILSPQSITFIECRPTLFNTGTRQEGI